MSHEVRIMSHVFSKYVCTSFVLATCFLILTSSQKVTAQTPTITTRQEIKQEIKTLRQTLRGKIVRINKGTITAMSGNTLTVTSDGKTYTVTTSASTNLRRHFFGKALLTEFSVNDQVDIVGTTTDDTGLSLNARLVRDVSIMKRRGVFFGTISAISGNTITLSTLERGTQTVTVSANTKYLTRDEKASSLTTLHMGDRIRVRGLWDKANNTITEVTEVKDFTLAPSPTQ